MLAGARGKATRNGRAGLGLFVRPDILASRNECDHGVPFVHVVREAFNLCVYCSGSDTSIPGKTLASENGRLNRRAKSFHRPLSFVNAHASRWSCVELD